MFVSGTWRLFQTCLCQMCAKICVWWEFFHRISSDNLNYLNFLKFYTTKIDFWPGPGGDIFWEKHASSARGSYLHGDRVTVTSNASDNFQRFRFLLQYNTTIRVYTKESRRKRLRNSEWQINPLLASELTPQFRSVSIMVMGQTRFLWCRCAFCFGFFFFKHTFVALGSGRWRISRELGPCI